MNDDMETGQRVVRLARAWIGTPYHHQAAIRGVGCDCLGLVRGVWREHMGQDCETPPAYSPDWGESNSVETMLEAARRHLTPCDVSDLKPGHVIVFRIQPTAVCKHVAILTTADNFIHASEGAAVAEVPLSSWWRRRIAGAFAFPATPQHVLDSEG